VIADTTNKLTNVGYPAHEKLMDRLPTMRFLEAIMQSQLQKPHYSVNPLGHKPDTQLLKKLKKLHKPKLPKAAKESDRISQLTQKRLNRNEKATAKVS
jgi:hypothetical protein